MSSSHEREPAAVRVTTARHSHTEDIRLRERRYMLMQACRVACVVLGALLPVAIGFKACIWVGAVVLPWLGVVMANAGPTVSRKRSNAIQDGLTETQTTKAVTVDPSRVIDG